MLKDEGTLLINCPIYVHGNKLFMQGKIEIIKNIFMHNKWKRLIFEYWRKDHSDLMPYCPHARKEYFKKQFNIDLDNIWLLNVVAEK